jgi:uncharacterized protein (UPF0276 family)
MGISLRDEWVDPLLSAEPPIPALEVIFEQWVSAPESSLRKLEQLRERYPLLLHCLSLNLGSSDPLDPEYVDAVRAFADRFSVAAVSDHLSWRSTESRWSLSLLPMPRTEEALGHLAGRVDAVQSRIGRSIALENISQYLPTPGDIPLAVMFNELHRRRGTAIHLDLNNLLVTERWLGESPKAFLDALTADVAWVHVAGHEDVPLPVDDHSHLPSQACLGLLGRVPPGAPVIFEWDRHRPSFADLLPNLFLERMQHARHASR